MFKYIIIALTVTIVNAGNVGLLGTAYSDATAVSSVYNSVAHQNNHEHQHETYIAKAPAAALALHSAPTIQVHSVPASIPAIQVHSSSSAIQAHSTPVLKLHTVPNVQVHSKIHTTPGLSVHSTPNLKLEHSVPAVQVHHSAAPILNLHSVPTSSIVHHSAAPLLKLQSPPVTSIVQHSVPTAIKVHSAPSSVIKVQNSIPTVKLQSASHLSNDLYSYHAAHQPAAPIVYSNNKLPVAYTAKEIHYSLAPEVSHVSVEGHGTHYAW